MESVGDTVIGLGAGNDEVQCYAVGDEAIIDLMKHFSLIQGVRIAHSAKADLTALGVTRHSSFYPLFDTMIAAYLIAEWPTLNLKDLASFILSQQIMKYEDLLAKFKAVDLGGVPVQDIAEYNMSQIAATYGLWKALSPRIEMDPTLQQVFDLEMQIVPILGNMEEAGIMVDRKKLLQLGKRFAEEGQDLQLSVAELTNGHIVNVNSPLQVRNYIFGREEGQLGAHARYHSKKTGTPKTDERVLKILLQKDPEKYAWVRILLRARQIKKLVGTYCIGIAKRLDAQHRSHTQLSQVTAETGRLASKEPNHQNIPKRRIEGLEIRRCMIAPPEHLLIACDMDQLELRIIAEESQEPKMREVFISGGDIHLQTAIDVFGDPSKRFQAKVFNYTISYLAGPQQIADQLRITKRKAELLQQNYFRKYHTLTKWIIEWDELCAETKSVRTWYGRERNLERFYTEQRGYEGGGGFKLTLNGRHYNVTDGMRKAVNTRIQGTAAEVLKLAMVRIDKRLVAEGCRSRMLMQIHDEILLEAPLNEVETAKCILREEMTTKYKGMPLPCTVKVGQNWADVH